MPQQLAPPRTRSFCVIAQDPSVLGLDGRILRSTVAVPAEILAPGPWGYRVQVVDYDSATRRFSPPTEHAEDAPGDYDDPYAGADDATIVGEPGFHARNAYAIVMHTLARFERALGRRVSWGFGTHQLKVLPHAFADANAFYSRRDEALLFGYFPTLDGKGTVHTCLSHDIIAHETTHAILDGLRGRFIDPSSPDQAAFHEGFADVVALLSVFALPGVVKAVLGKARDVKKAQDRIDVADVHAEVLRQSVLLGLADQMGRELESSRGEALRRSVGLEPSTDYLTQPEFMPAHRRGEILVAAVMHAFVEVWSERLSRLSTEGVAPAPLDLQRVAEEGTDAADHLLTMAIRALDYMPPVHIEFGDFLSATITADVEIRPDDSRYRFRDNLRRSFAAYGIAPSVGTRRPTRAMAKDEGAPQAPEPGAWVPCNTLALSYDRTHFEPMAREPDEVFRFIWENRETLQLYEGAFSRVLSVRPTLRVGVDGFALHETVVEFYQVLRLRADEVRRALGIATPAGMPDDVVVPLYGGGTLIFDEYGRLKFYLHNSLDNATRQAPRIAYLWQQGWLPERGARTRDFAAAHRLRAMDAVGEPQEVW
jgi:hypothetical protein